MQHDHRIDKFNPPMHERDQMHSEALEALRGAESFILFVFTEDEEECGNPLCEGHPSAQMFGNCSTFFTVQAHAALGEEVKTAKAIHRLASLPRATRAQVAEMIAAGIPDEG
jgi:hypothetical protein